MYIGKTIQTANALAVAGVTSGVWTTTFNSGFSTAFGIWIKCSSSSTVAVRVVLEESWISLTLAQQNLTNSNYVVPDAFPDIFADIVDTNAHVKALFPVPMRHARYKLIGLAGNSSDTTVTIYTFLQEPGRSYGE